MKWVALGFLVVGIGLIVGGLQVDKHSTLTDTSFANETLMFLVGGACLIIAVVLLILATFIAI